MLAVTERGRGGSYSQTSNLNRTLKSDCLAAHAETPGLHKGKQIGEKCKRNARCERLGLVIIVPTAERHQGVKRITDFMTSNMQNLTGKHNRSSLI